MHSFNSYLLQRESKERELSRTKQLERESSYYESRLKRDLRSFINEGSSRQDCSMRKRYTNLLQQSLQKRPAFPSYASQATLKYNKYL